VRFFGCSFLSTIYHPSPLFRRLCLVFRRAFPLTMSSGIGELDVAGWTSDAYRWMRTAPAASYLQPLEGIPSIPPPPFSHSCDSHCWLSFLLSTGAGAARPCTAITHCRKHLNVFMCKRLSLKLPAALSFCSPQAVSYRLFRSPSSPLFLFLLSLVLHSFPLLSITATKMFPLLS